ncbi:VWA domain-containing protein [soil metagenome]
MNEQIFGIFWTAPENKIYFWLFAVALVFIAYRWMRSYKLIKMLGKKVNGQTFLKNTSITRITIKSILWTAALFFMFLALLKPSWNKKEEKVIQEGRDLFVALDISRSMLAQDVLPNRLTHAKNMIHKLVDALPSDRVGLILFSGSSFVQCPLTRDRNAFYLYLDQIDTDTIASGTTALDKAIEQALNAFKESGTKKNKLLLLFTDGEDFSSNLAALKQEAQSQGATIFTIGVGTTQGAPIPVFDVRGTQAGHLRDSKGTVVITALNEGILQSLAQDVGGIYVHASSYAPADALSFGGHGKATADRQKGERNLEQLIRLIESREKEKLEEKKLANYEHQYPFFLTISLVLIIIEWLL